METINKIEALGEEALHLAETKLYLWKLKAVDQTAKFASKGVWSICLVMLGVLFMLMINIGLALWIGEKMGRLYYGFFTVSVFYILLAVILYIFRKQLIRRPISNFVIKSFLHA
jgi:hypothetical protein